MERLCHPQVLGLLGGEALVGGVAGLSQPRLLLETLNALLGLFWEQETTVTPIAGWRRTTQVPAARPRSRWPHGAPEQGSPEQW